MLKVRIPRAFPSFDPHIHVAKCRGKAKSVKVVLIGVDIGSAAPCVALHGALMQNNSIRIFREEFEPEMGLERFIDADSFGRPECVDFLCCEHSCVARSPLDATTQKSRLEAAGHKVLVCKSSPRWRHKSINEHLDSGDGIDGIAVDPSCTNLIEALIGHRVAYGSGGVWKCGTPHLLHVIDGLGYLVEGFTRWRCQPSLANTTLAMDAES